MQATVHVVSEKRCAYEDFKEYLELNSQAKDDVKVWAGINLGLTERHARILIDLHKEGRYEDAQVIIH